MLPGMVPCHDAVVLGAPSGSSGCPARRGSEL